MYLEYTNKPKVLEAPKTDKAELLFKRILPLVIKGGFLIVMLMIAVEVGVFQ